MKLERTTHLRRAFIAMLIDLATAVLLVTFSIWGFFAEPRNVSFLFPGNTFVYVIISLALVFLGFFLYTFRQIVLFREGPH